MKKSYLFFIALFIFLLNVAIYNFYLFNDSISIKKMENLTEEQFKLYNNSSLIVWWTNVFGQRRPENIHVCDENNEICVETTRIELIEKATTVIFHARDIDWNKIPKRLPHHNWIIYSQESPANEPILKDPERIRLFDHSMTYRLDSDFPSPYISKKYVGRNITSKRNDTPIVWIAQNCLAYNSREIYIEELMKHIKVDSYGRCLNNKEFPTDEDKNDIKELVSHYKFYLAIENSDCLDYITEKYDRCLRLGVVPIVGGTRKLYEKYMPSNHSVIFIEEFSSPKELAKYIDYLDKNDDEYYKYLDFQKQDFELPLSLSTPNLCCETGKWKKEFLKNPFKLKATTVNPDYSCFPPKYLSN